MYIKRRTIEVLGGLDEQYHPCYYEDSDYCYSAWQKGIATVVTPYSVVVHHEGSTAGTDSGTGYKSYQLKNRREFVSKHRNYLNKIDSSIKSFNKSLRIKSL